ncbi:hypothetical protein MHI37_06910 [Paenibacillus sp. FSL H8-0548]|uniref:hypothetical protein n=1 Tax=Paenibacillus sp. FSL H8-0548 TaxID=1920422 RepID=UPI0015C3A1C6|nr:hypothetical protein [Paenibacillus sp. FSL H8-0548]
MEIWTNNACLGYVIKAMRDAGKSDKEIQEMVNSVRGQFDWVSVEEAAEVYNKSPY